MWLEYSCLQSQFNFRLKVDSYGNTLYIFIYDYLVMLIAQNVTFIICLREKYCQQYFLLPIFVKVMAQEANTLWTEYIKSKSVNEFLLASSFIMLTSED